ncbi:unnamed protein product [Lactuca saligna]|uniref:ditrans,polycis-polyprenyl diphosphate synthase [(2E,6E)-farnesyldiphosphate specific] n=1 Tax=Lactuca saligna TaxID=75948 RepID=A0AA36A4N2_LACSI|nr:unnamed protein product [Lactuca saligna]
MRAIESYLIANGIVKTYEDLNLNRVKYFGIVVDSDEACETSKVIELLEWLSHIGVKKGVLKMSKEVFLEKFDSMVLRERISWLEDTNQDLCRKLHEYRNRGVTIDQQSGSREDIIPKTRGNYFHEECCF